MDEHCVIYSEMSDYVENEIWRFHIVGELIPEVEQDMRNRDANLNSFDKSVSVEVHQAKGV